MSLTTPLTDKLQSIKLQDNEELVSFDVSALFTSIPVNQALDVINKLIIQHQTDMDFKYKVGKAWYEVADHPDSLLNYLNSIDPNIKFTIEPPNEQGAIPFWTHFQDHLATKLSLQFTENLPIQIGIWISTLIIQNRLNVQLLEL